MQGPRTSAIWVFVRAVGSLWFGSILLILLLVAMACATIYESTFNAERALHAFYLAWWFHGLLALLAANLTAAAVVRYPFTRRQVGFVITHGSILLILGGALVTHLVGIEGQLVLTEGMTGREIALRDTAVTIQNRSTQARAVIDLNSADFRGWAPVDRPSAKAGLLDRVRVEVERFLPDSVAVERVVNDNPEERPAVEIALTGAEAARTQWVFDGQSARIGDQTAMFRVVDDEQAFQQLLNDPSSIESTGRGVVNVEHGGRRFSFSLDECMNAPAAIGDSGLTVQVLRYLAHATVGPDNRLVDSSSQPSNPAIEAEIVGPNGKERRVAFARFPDFQSMHGTPDLQDVRLTFVASATPESRAGIEIVGVANAPDLLARFSAATGVVTKRIEALDRAVETPWSGRSLTVRRRFERARVDRICEPYGEIREDRSPAVLVKVASAVDAASLWLEKNRPMPVSIDGLPFELTYEDKTIPLGFDVTLNRFTVGRYPGEGRPRSFESQITITDAAAGRSQGRVISMNHPTSYRGFTLFQSSYNLDGKKAVSILSVSRDPGQLIVFTGYVALIVGMLIVLGTRMSDRRRAGLPAAAIPARSTGRPLDLLGAAARCVGDGRGIQHTHHDGAHAAASTVHRLLRERS